jgi:hypothetical protein
MEVWGLVGSAWPTSSTQKLTKTDKQTKFVNPVCIDKNLPFLSWNLGIWEFGTGK